MAGHRRQSALPGFTLIESVVVVAITVLLLGITSTSVHDARATSMHSTCIARLRTIGQASKIYEAEDPNGLGIPVHPLFANHSQDSFIGAYEWGGKSGIGRQEGPGSVRGPTPALGSKYGTYAGFGPATRPMNKLFYPNGLREIPLDRRSAELDTKLDLREFRCPADDGPPRGAHCTDWIQRFSQTPAYDYFGTSYSANLFMVGCDAEIYSNSPFLRPMSRVPFPSRTLTFEEVIGRWAWAAKEDPCTSLTGVHPGPTKAVPGWHDKNWTFNWSFADGRVDTVSVYEEGTEGENGYANHYRAETLSSYPPCASNTGSFQFYRCIIVRGSGWAKDTLPSSPIPTGLNLTGQSNSRPSYEDCVTGAAN